MEAANEILLGHLHLRLLSRHTDTTHKKVTPNSKPDQYSIFRNIEIINVHSIHLSELVEDVWRI